jgi:hypothetical protein
VYEFQASKASLEAPPDGIENNFKKSFWKYLLKHKEIILKAGDKLLHPEAGDCILPTVPALHFAIC